MERTQQQRRADEHRDTDNAVVIGLILFVVTWGVTGMMVFGY